MAKPKKPKTKRMSEEEKRKARRKFAREVIVVEANKHRQRNRPCDPLGLRHLNQAVNICRQNKLVKASVLTEAGFNPVRSK